MSEKFKVFIASDHAGFEMKQKIMRHLRVKNFDLIDRGPDNNESVDYPDYAKKVASDVFENISNKGILICGSGQGMAMVANRHAGIRAAVCSNPEVAKLARAHNDANILTLGARFIDEDMAIKCVDEFFSTDFDRDRHMNRVKKIG
jgi:ribose 5-phosphate isomerase B